MDATHPVPSRKAHRGNPLERLWASKTTRRFRRNPLAVGGALIITGFVFLAVFAPQLTEPGRNCLRDLGLTATTTGDLRNPLSPTFWRAIVASPASCYNVPRASFSPIPEPPSPGRGFILGTTSGGYDIYYGIVWGARTAFRVGLIVVGSSLFAGVIVGALAGYFGGVLDNVLMRFTDVVFAFPNLVLAIVLVVILGQSLNNVMVALALVQWPTYARLVRGDILRVKQQEFVDGARALGARNFWIISRHVLPNAVGALVIVASLDIGTVVITAATLSFIGVGAPVGYADWGQMINFARDWILGPPGRPFAYWYVSFWPGLAILLFSVAWNLIGDAFRDVLDPRSR